MKFIALYAIRFYQRAISPYKGYCCAYAAASGRASCSGLGYRAIRRYGVWRGLAVLNGRLEKCGIAYRRHMPSQLNRQAGFLDCACDAGACDVGACDLISGADVCLSACNVPGDCNWKRRRSKNDDEYVVIPSRGNVRN